jgi:hypothetical protein
VTSRRKREEGREIGKDKERERERERERRDRKKGENEEKTRGSLSRSFDARSLARSLLQPRAGKST